MIRWAWESAREAFSLFATPHTYHLDIRFEQGFTQCPELARAIMAAIEKGKRVVVEHFDLIYPFLKREGSDLPVNADVMIGVGEEVIVTRPDLFGPIPQDIANIVFKSIRYRKMIHSAEDITGYFLSHGHPEDYEHAEVKSTALSCALKINQSFRWIRLKKRCGRSSNRMFRFRSMMRSTSALEMLSTDALRRATMFAAPERSKALP